MGIGKMLDKGVKKVATSVGLIGGFLAGSQVPAYFQNFTQRVGGMRDEAVNQLKEFENIAESLDMTFREYVSALINGDVTAELTGEYVSHLPERVDTLRNAYEGLLYTVNNGMPFDEVIEFLEAVKEVGYQPVYNALEAFGPSIQLSGEGLAYGAITALLGAGIARGAYGLAKWALSGRKRKKIDLKD